MPRPPDKKTAMVHLRDKENGAYLGAISELQLQFLRDRLEEESENDTDYYIDTATLQMLEKQGADPGLLEILSRGLRGRDEMEIQWRHA